MGTMTITLLEQRAIPGATPDGTLPMAVAIHSSDEEEDAGHLGLFLPVALVKPQDPQTQRLVCAYVARAAIRLGDEEDRSGNQAQKLLADLTNDRWAGAEVRLRAKDQLQWHTRFEWSTEGQSLDELAQVAEAHHRSLQLHAVAEGRPEIMEALRSKGKRTL